MYRLWLETKNTHRRQITITSLADFSPGPPTCPRHAAMYGRRCTVRRPICMLPDKHTNTHTHTHTHTQCAKVKHNCLTKPLTHKQASPNAAPQPDGMPTRPCVQRRIGSLFSSPQRPHRLRPLPQSSPRFNGYRDPFPVLQRPEREADHVP
jgi:hypothetical protein